MDCDQQIARANAVKTAIYSEGSDQGLDKDAMWQAFRRYARELKNPEATDRYNFLNERTESYLKELRGETVLPIPRASSGD